MTEFFGRDLQFIFAGTGGSINMSEYQRGASFNPTGKIDAVTTGSALAETRMVGVKDFTASYKGLWQSVGTAIEALIAFGEVGTVFLGPEGTATGMRKYTLPVISQGPQVNTVYDGVTELNCSFVGNGTPTYGAYGTAGI
jgi:hypothetical protein